MYNKGSRRGAPPSTTHDNQSSHLTWMIAGPSPSALVSVLYMMAEQNAKTPRQPAQTRTRCCFGALFVIKKAVGTTRYGAQDAIRRESYASGEHSVTAPRCLKCSLYAVASTGDRSPASKARGRVLPLVPRGASAEGIFGCAPTPRPRSHVGHRRHLGHVFHVAQA